MGVDLHRIGTGISSGGSHNGFGNIVSYPSGGGGNPPYGTILSTGTEPLTLNWAYTDTASGSGNFQYGSYPYYTRADGAGGSFLDFTTGMSLAVETATFNQVIESVNDANYRIIYKGGFGVNELSAGTWSECIRQDYVTGNGGSGNVYVDVTDNYGNTIGAYTVGSYSYVEKGNGTCGTYNDYTYDYSSYPYGTYLTTWFNNATGYNYDSYADGAGGYYDVQQ